MKKILATVMAAIIMATSLFSATTAQAATTADFNTEVQTRYDTIMASMQAKIVNGVDGNDILYSVGWYEDLEPLEVAARCIYGEAPWWIADKKCVAMVLWNRREKSWYPDTLYDVAVQAGQFAAITGDEDETEGARIVDITTSSWQNALRFACIIWTARVLGVEPDSYISVPTGFTDQLFFLSYGSFFSKTYDVDSGVDSDNDGENEIVSYMTNSEGTFEISDIFVPVHGAFDSVTAAKAAYDASTNAAWGLPYNAIGERVNIYFSR